MSDPARCLIFATAILNAPSREVAVHLFAALCAEDLEAAANWAQFIGHVVPATTAWWAPVLEEAAKRAGSPPFEWGDSDTTDTAEEVDTFLRGGEHAPES